MWMAGQQQEILFSDIGISVSNLFFRKYPDWTYRKSQNYSIGSFTRIKLFRKYLVMDRALNSSICCDSNNRTCTNGAEARGGSEENLFQKNRLVMGCNHTCVLDTHHPITCPWWYYVGYSDSDPVFSGLRNNGCFSSTADYFDLWKPIYTWTGALVR